MKDPNAAKLEKHRGVYWLPCSATEHTDRAPLCSNPRTARLAVEAPPISMPDPDATPMQLEESEETRRPKYRALPASVSKEEFDAHQLTHLPFDFQSGAVFSAMVVKGGDPYALAVALEEIKFTGRTRLIIMSDQENAVKNLVDMIRDSTHETAVINTPKGSSASAGRIERANYEVEKQIRTLRSRFEQSYWESVGLDHKMLPFLVRHCAWLITHFQVKSDGKTPRERLRGRPYQGLVAEFAEVVHFRIPREAADMPKLDDRCNLGLWLGKSLASDEHYVGTSAGVRRCRSTWRRPEKQRWDRKMLTEMNGEPWNPVPPKDKAPQVRGVYITLERQHGGKVVLHASGMQRCIRQNAGHDSRILWTMKLHRQQLRVQVNQTSRCRNRQRVAPRPVQAVARHWLRVDPRWRMSTWAQQKVRQHSRRVLRFGRWRLRTMEVQNVRG